ncbi:MAG: acyltransferase family protein [Rubrobacter sp.]
MKNTSFGLQYSPGLDGLRAIAVLAVLLYHADITWLRGGFLGVEVFFVISGFLITSLLLAEYRKTGTIDFLGFWFRRARRLLPAVFFMMIVTTTYAVAFLPEEVAGLRSDALAAAGYATNWYLIFANESYFEAVGRPSLLQHLWSLAVEEQFYLVWPIVSLANSGRWRVDALPARRGTPSYARRHRRFGLPHVLPVRTRYRPVTALLRDGHAGGGSASGRPWRSSACRARGSSTRIGAGVLCPSVAGCAGSSAG